MIGEREAMNSTPSHLRRVAVGISFAGLVLSAPDTGAQATIALPPNLNALPASSISLIANTGGMSTLRFSTTSWNSGAGALQLEAGPVDTGSGKQQVLQRVFNNDGSSALFFAGWFEWHPAHNHFHFDNYALYTLQPVNAPGGYRLTGSKTTFCVMDTTRIDSSLPGAPQQAVYSACGFQLQGMSVGWGDTYGSHLPGQELDFTGNADGVYQLRIQIDPNNNIVESNKNDNESCVLLNIKKPNTVTVLDASGSCSLVQSITPNSALMGTSVQVTITGYGFSADMAVSFEGGNGTRPVASNIVLTSDTDGLDTITATVAVPSKKGRSKDPVWDLRVGDAILRNAFTVIR
jgi:hypothetical protein